MRGKVSRTASIVAWALQILTAAIFIFAGGKTLMADPTMVAVFAKVGIGQWFRLLTGGFEVVGGSPALALGLWLACLAIAWLGRDGVRRGVPAR